MTPTFAAGAVLALALVSAPSAAQSATATLASDVVVVPMSHATRHVTVEVRVNGKGPYLFQVDTYASIDACVDDEFAEELGLEQIGTVMNSDGRVRRVKPIVLIDELVLGDAKFEGLRTLVDDYDFIARADGRKVHGLLGFALFRDLLLTFDYPGDRLVLSTERLTAETPHSLPLDTSNGAPNVILPVGDERLEFGIDTGAVGNFTLQLGDAERLPLGSEPVRVGTASTVYSTYAIFRAPLAVSIDLAGHELENPTVSFAEGEARRLMGYGTVCDYLLAFDQRSQRVRFELPVPPAAPEEAASEAQAGQRGR